MLVFALRPSHRPLSEWFSNLFLCIGWNSLEDVAGYRELKLRQKKSKKKKAKKKVPSEVEHCGTYFLSFVLFSLFVVSLAASSPDMPWLLSLPVPFA